MGKLDSKHIAILATEGVEQVELTEPRKALEAEGAQITMVSLEQGDFQGFEHLDKGETFTADKAVAECSPEDFDGVVVPGGVANGDFLRADQDAVRFVRGFFDALSPHSRGVYVNFTSDDANSRAREAYSPAQWARLTALKAKYDPTNFFRLNANIPPS